MTKISNNFLGPGKNYNPADFADNLKTIMFENWLSRDSFPDHLPMTVSTLDKLLNGVSKPSNRIVDEICKIFAIERAALFLPAPIKHYSAETHVFIDEAMAKRLSIQVTAARSKISESRLKEIINQGLNKFEAHEISQLRCLKYVGTNLVHPHKTFTSAILSPFAAPHVDMVNFALKETLAIEKKGLKPSHYQRVALQKLIKEQLIKEQVIKASQPFLPVKLINDFFSQMGAPYADSPPQEMYKKIAATYELTEADLILMGKYQLSSEQVKELRSYARELEKLAKIEVSLSDADLYHHYIGMKQQLAVTGSRVPSPSMLEKVLGQVKLAKIAVLTSCIITGLVKSAPLVAFEMLTEQATEHFAHQANEAAQELNTLNTLLYRAGNNLGKLVLLVPKTISALVTCLFDICVDGNIFNVPFHVIQKALEINHFSASIVQDWREMWELAHELLLQHERAPVCYEIKSSRVHATPQQKKLEIQSLIEELKKECPKVEDEYNEFLQEHSAADGYIDEDAIHDSVDVINDIERFLAPQDAPSEQNQPSCSSLLPDPYPDLYSTEEVIYQQNYGERTLSAHDANEEGDLSLIQKCMREELGSLPEVHSKPEYVDHAANYSHELADDMADKMTKPLGEWVEEVCHHAFSAHPSPAHEHTAPRENIMVATEPTQYAISISLNGKNYATTAGEGLTISPVKKAGIAATYCAGDQCQVSLNTPNGSRDLLVKCQPNPQHATRVCTNTLTQTVSQPANHRSNSTSHLLAAMGATAPTVMSRMHTTCDNSTLIKNCMSNIENLANSEQTYHTHNLQSTGRVNVAELRATQRPTVTYPEQANWPLIYANSPFLFTQFQKQVPVMSFNDVLANSNDKGSSGRYCDSRTGICYDLGSFNNDCGNKSSSKCESKLSFT